MKISFEFAGRALASALVVATLLLSAAYAQAREFSAGILRLAGLETESVAPVDGEQGSSIFFPIESSAASTTPSASVDASRFEFAPTANEVASDSSTAYLGAGTEFSYDAVLRGSVNLPAINMLQFWGNAYAGNGRVRPVGIDETVRNNNAGASVGLTIPLGVATISGYYNYHQDREFFDAKRFEQKDNSYGMAAYANLGGFYFALAGFYGDDDYSGRGAVASSEVAEGIEYKKSHFSGSQSCGYFETGYEMMNMGLFVLKPFGAYRYSNIRTDKFDVSTLEKLSGKQKYNSCQATLGSRIDLNLAGLDTFTMQFRMAWSTELRSKSESMRSFSYGRVPGTLSPSSPYYLGHGGGSDVFWCGAGLRLSLFGALSCAVDYDCYFNKRQTQHETSLGLLFGF